LATKKEPPAPNTAALCPLSVSLGAFPHFRFWLQKQPLTGFGMGQRQKKPHCE
jgi:hypothetical protein